MTRNGFGYALGLSAGLAMAAACSPATEVGPAPQGAPASQGVDATTPGNPFFGTWSLARARIAPWWDHMGEEPAADPAMASISLGPNGSSGAPLLMCDKPKYVLNIVPSRWLFEGNLPDPPKDAAELGFKDTDITAMTFSCASGAADVSLDFPMIDDDTIMLGLDNVLYTFKRTR